MWGNESLIYTNIVPDASGNQACPKMTGLFAEEAEETNMKTYKASSSGEINVGFTEKAVDRCSTG